MIDRPSISLWQEEHANMVAGADRRGNEIERPCIETLGQLA
jgi:hypothetical protein